MPVGISDGTSYDDSSEWLANSGDKPYTGGNLGPLQRGPKIDDRRDESFVDKASAYLSQNLSTEKLDFIMSHPNPFDEMSFNAWKAEKNTIAQPPVPDSELGKQLGSDDITMPLGGSTEPAGALKPGGSTNVPEKAPRVKIGDLTPSGEVVRHTTSTPLINFTDEDIERGIHVAFGASTNPIQDLHAAAGPLARYIDMFVKQPQVQKIAQPIRDSFEEVYKQIHEAIEGPGTYKPGTSEFDKKYGYNQPTTLEQQPLLDTQSATWHDYSTDQLHPDNFYNIKQSVLSPKQALDLHATWDDLKEGTISKGEYLNELREYEKFTNAKHIPIKEDKAFDADAEWAKIKDQLSADAEEYVKLQPKLSPKEAFLRGVEETHARLTTTLANIRNKFLTSIKEPKLEKPDIKIPEAAREKGYIEPAYRGLTVYEGKELNPVYKYDDGGQLYSTASPVLADMYANYLSKHPGFKVPEGTFKEGSQVMPLLVNTKDYHYYDAKGGHWTVANNKAMQEAHQLKKPGVIVDNVWDEPNSTHNLSPKKIFITFPKGASTVKSRFAERFDASSPNMMHSITGIGLGGSAGYIGISEMHDDRE